MSLNKQLNQQKISKTICTAHQIIRRALTNFNAFSTHLTAPIHAHPPLSHQPHHGKSQRENRAKPQSSMRKTCKDFDISFKSVRCISTTTFTPSPKMHKCHGMTYAHKNRQQRSGRLRCGRRHTTSTSSLPTLTRRRSPGISSPTLRITVAFAHHSDSPGVTLMTNLASCTFRKTPMDKLTAAW